MNLLITLGISVVAASLVLLLIAASRAAYRGGIRDGYQNTWLPHVQEQIQEEQLHQGHEVQLRKEER